MVELDRVVVGNVIKQLRREKGKTQEVTSGLCGISRSHLSAIESGGKSIHFDTLWKIAFALEVSPSTLVRCIEDAHIKIIDAADSPETPPSNADREA